MGPFSLISHVDIQLKCHLLKIYFPHKSLLPSLSSIRRWSLSGPVSGPLSSVSLAYLFAHVQNHVVLITIFVINLIHGKANSSHILVLQKCLVFLAPSCILILYYFLQLAIMPSVVSSTLGTTVDKHLLIVDEYRSE